MIESAMLLMGMRGVEATSFSEVLAHSGAPRGSIYHHFPGGKAELIAEATRYGGEFLAAGMRAAVDEADPVAAVDSIADFWRGALRSTSFAAGCPVVAATIEGDRTPTALDAAADAFRSWKDLYIEILQRTGMPRERAKSLAATLVAGMEGGIILARAERSMAPLEAVVEELHALLRSAVGAAPPPAGASRAK
jgi:AcrR family transcriptional regulator